VTDPSPFILSPTDDPERVARHAGGKAGNLARMSRAGLPVPEWFAVTTAAFDRFLGQFGLDPGPPPAGDLAQFASEVEKRFLAAPLPPEVESAIDAALASPAFRDAPLAVRSSGLDEDSPDHSFAGQFSSFLHQRGRDAVLRSLRRCFASGFSERALAYRRERGLPLTGIRVGVVIQRMVEAETAGVAFSRNPVRPLDRETVVVEAVHGLGEGLVGGELDGDRFELDRATRAIRATLAERTHAIRAATDGSGVARVELDSAMRARPALTDAQVREVADLTLRLETQFGAPQDCEWAFAGGQLHLLQTRPITGLPPASFFARNVNGDNATLWDNSNIIESYGGVTSPLTFSFASNAYRQVYLQFCEVMGVPRAVVDSYQTVFRNMLGLVRGRIYYNLINWYRLVMILPGASTNKGFMDTMMGVKQSLKPELASLFDFVNTIPKPSLFRRLGTLAVTLTRFLRIDAIVKRFQEHFDAIYQAERRAAYRTLPLPELVARYVNLDEQILRRWQAPIVNDYLVMIFFGLLKRLTEKWIAEGGDGASLQNDLLCGEGDLESTKPTKWLMAIAERIDRSDAEARAWLLGLQPEPAFAELRAGKGPAWLRAELDQFLDQYGFRCVNELKLEEPDLHDDPSFLLNAIAGYVRTKSWSVETMARRETEIRARAEEKARERLTGWRRRVYFWVLRQARRAVRTRENLRFDRTKIFGVARHLFRAIGARLAALGVIDGERDVFYLTVEEILAFVEGRPVSLDLRGLASARRREFDEYRRTPSPPDRFLTVGAAGAAMRYEAVLADGDLLRSERAPGDDPDLLHGTPCCPGIVEGTVRLARTLDDARGIAGEILVTGRTDPGWVPLYPSCSALLIERGSLLSHSAVVARELGLPTIVGISGGLMERLKTGDRVRVDAGKGEVRIIRRGESPAEPMNRV